MSTWASPTVTRIAMWSGPRNISTAMMRAWENRADTAVVDEPFYAAYLTATGIVHPMQEQVLASQSSDYSEVINTVLSAKLGYGVSIQYQKHMTQHMVTDIDMDWFKGLRHAFLIRHPAAVVASYGEKRGDLSADDLGYKRQKELFDMACEVNEQIPPVIDSKDVLTDPVKSLNVLCSALSVPFDESMLSWPAGRRKTDGVWAQHWYQSVENSTTFAPYQDKAIELTHAQQVVVDQCLAFYEAMKQHCLNIE